MDILELRKLCWADRASLDQHSAHAGIACGPPVSSVQDDRAGETLLCQCFDPWGDRLDVVLGADRRNKNEVGRFTKRINGGEMVLNAWRSVENRKLIATCSPQGA